MSCALKKPAVPRVRCASRRQGRPRRDPNGTIKGAEEIVPERARSSLPRSKLQLQFNVRAAVILSLRFRARECSRSMEIVKPNRRMKTDHIHDSRSHNPDLQNPAGTFTLTLTAGGLALTVTSGSRCSSPGHRPCSRRRPSSPCPCSLCDAP